MAITVAANTKEGFYESNTGTVQVSSIVPRWPYAGDVTPPELLGNNPIHEPTYGGDIDHLLVLDKNWVIVSINVMTKLYDEIDTLASGSVASNMASWYASIDAGSPNYTYRSNARTLRNTHFKAAKTTVEIPLGTAANFDITSADDSNYSSAQNPNQCDRVYISVGGDTDNGDDQDTLAPYRDITGSPGLFVINYRVYSYLEMPTSLVEGDTYTITYGSDSVTFLFDSDATVSRAIKVNQLGYMSDAGVKKAYLGAHLFQFGELDLSHASTYQVINADTGAVANSGNVDLVELAPQYNPQLDTGTTAGTAQTNKLVDTGATFTATSINIKVGDRVYNTTDTTEADVTAVDSGTILTLSSDIFIEGENYEIRRLDAAVDTALMYGEDVYEIDFSAMTATGTFYIKVPGVGRSWPFLHGTTTYSQLYYTSMRGMYHQRQGSEITTKYSPWARRSAKTGPYYYENELLKFPKHDVSTDPVDDSGGHSATDVLSQSSTSGSGTGFSLTVDTDNLSGGKIITHQDETDYDNSPTTEGTFNGGSGHNVGDVITITGGATILVTAESGNVVTQFTVTSYDFNVFNTAGGTTNYNTVTTQSPGGWYDAADWDSSTYHYTCIFDMLNAYELNSANLTDDQLDIPESGDGVPDILSEVRHGLEIWRLSQDANGGISGFLETWTHPDIKSTITGDNPPGTHKTDYGYGTRTRWDSLVFAAAAAQYARLVQNFDPTDSTNYEGYAVDAYDFGNNSANALGPDFVINYTESRGAGPASGAWAITEDDSWIDPYWMHAKLQLWLLTGTDTYITNTPSVATLAARIQNPYIWRWNRQDWSQWVHYSIIQAYDAGYTGLSVLAGTWEQWFTDNADLLLTYLETQPYECTWLRNNTDAMAWGATNMMNFNKGLFIADAITARADSKYYDAALQNADYALGCNPLGMSWTTGVGYVYPIELQHDTSSRDIIMDPVPGITLYGLTNISTYSQFTDTVQTSDGTDFVTDDSQRPANRLIWRKYTTHPTLLTKQNEFTMGESLGSTLFTAAMLVGYTAVTQTPRPKDNLYGRWYII